MKIEIDVDLSQAGVNKIINDRVTAIATAFSGSWEIERNIKERLKALWNPAIDELIVAKLANSQAIEQALNKAMQDKIKAKLDRLMKSSGE